MLSTASCFKLANNCQSLKIYSSPLYKSTLPILDSPLCPKMMPQAKKMRLNSYEIDSDLDLSFEGENGLEASQSQDSLLSNESLEAEMEKYREPEMTFLELIVRAIMETPTQMLYLQEIYDTLEWKYPYFQVADPSWKNSVRHNLSTHPCFVKVKPCEKRKGFYWGIHQANLPDFHRGKFGRRLIKSRVREFNQHQERENQIHKSYPQTSSGTFTNTVATTASSARPLGHYDGLSQSSAPFTLVNTTNSSFPNILSFAMTPSTVRTRLPPVSPLPYQFGSLGGHFVFQPGPPQFANPPLPFNQAHPVPIAGSRSSFMQPLHLPLEQCLVQPSVDRPLGYSVEKLLS